MKLEYDKLYDRYSEVEHAYKEIALRFQGLEKTYNQMDKERSESHKKIMELSQML